MSRRVVCSDPCDSSCQTPCALAVLPAGVRAIIVSVACPHAEANRLRVLGLFEGASVSVVDCRSAGLLLDVCGSRLAIAMSLALAITALPVSLRV